ncbi:MFS transporter [Streptomyces sp. MNU77]|nr:MFS transporter [Streptomyces sp. MNU77]
MCNVSDKTASSHATRTLVVLSFAGITSATMQTVIVPVVPQLPGALGTSAATAAWAVTITMLVSSVLTPVTGRLGDMFGRKPVILACTVPMLVGSVLCATAPNVTWMIVGRGLQGVGSGITPMGIALLRDVMPPDRRGSAIATMSASLGVGAAIGLPLSAGLAQFGSWQAPFWCVAGLCALEIVGVALLIPSVPRAARTERGTFDGLGAVGLGIVLVCLLLPVSKGADWGWSSPTVLGLLAGAVLVALAWGRWELGRTSPLVNLRTTARPQVLWTNIASLLVGMAMYAQQLVMPQLLQLPDGTGYGLGQGLLVSGLWMLPSGLMMMAMSPFGARVTARYGAKVTLVVGSLVIAAGYGFGQLLLGSAAGVMVATILCSAGTGLAYGAMPALVMSAVPRGETGAANSFNTIMRSIGTSTAAAMAGVVLAHLTTPFGGSEVPSLSGFRVILALGAGVALLSALIAAFLPARGVGVVPRGEERAEPARAAAVRGESR